VAEVGAISQLAAAQTANFVRRTDGSTEKYALFQIGTPRAFVSAWPDGRVTGNRSRGSKMFAIASRQMLTAFAGAFVTALLFVSAATSLPIA